MSIVPRNALIFCAGLIFLPCAAVLTALPSLSILCLVIMALMTVAVLTDALMFQNRFEGINARLPDIIRMSVTRKGEIDICINNENQKPVLIKIGLLFPDEIVSDTHDLTVQVPQNTPVSKVKWPCKPLKKGKYIIDKCRLETSSPFGFWNVRTTCQVHCEIRVYPDLFKESHDLAALFLRQNAGIHTIRQLGKGRDFEQLREYLPGDNYEDIHWKATAKRAYPVSKIYQVERTQQIYVILDASRLSARKIISSSENILDRYINAALIMALAAEKQGDHMGLLCFGSNIKSFIKAKSGKAHYNSCRDMLYTLEPETLSPDFTELFTFIATRIRRRSLLIFLTSMDDPVLSENFISQLDLIRKKHLILLNMIKPLYAKALFTEPIKSTDEIYMALGGHFLWSGLMETKKILACRNVEFSLLDNEKMCAQLVSQYLKIKQRQIL